jgi:hypothetical protein
MIYYRRFAFFALLLCFQINTVCGQKTSSRIIVESGGNVPLIVNSLKKYDEGVVLENWTKLYISFSDSIEGTPNIVNPASTWQLGVRANEATMYGDYFGFDARTLNLDYLRVEVTGIESVGGSPLYTGSPTEIVLSDADQTLITGGPQGNYRITLSYKLGKDAKLLGHPPDYYLVDLIFTLSKE